VRTAVEIAVLFAYSVVLLWGAGKVVAKAGYREWAAWLAFVPLVNLVAIALFVRSEWPVEREARLYREQQAAG
jgi:hypothetical protein